MKILYTPASPYSAKVRMAACYAGIALDSVIVDPMNNQPELIEHNPLGKIPTLVTQDGKAIFDSRTIMQFLDRESGHKLYPRNAARRTDVEVLEALCDGITDCLLAVVYERRFRPEEKVHHEWIERQWDKAGRGLDHLNANLPRTARKLNGGHFALAALTGYLDLRFPGQWERGRPKLKKWPDNFERRFPAYATFKSQA